MILLILLFLQTTLPLYEITVAPEQFDLLFEDPEAKIEVPAIITYEGITGDCTIAFRGGTALWLPKKSWHIRMEHPELLPGGGHILLNAQFRDPSLMRNTLGLFLTRELGLPAPKTEYVTLSINNEFMGVYERVERIDRLFFDRNNLSYGPLFKNVDVMGRLAPLFTDTTALTGFEPKIDSEPYSTQLLELIDNCVRNDVSSLQKNEFLAAFAVHAAIHDNDGIIKNFYLHQAYGVWHYYPWDRDATFGNSWKGEYQQNWLTEPHIFDIGYFGATNGLFASQSNIDTFNYYIQATASIMRNELPEMIDSLKLLIQEDLALDPFYQYSSSQFDSLCSVLVSDITERASFLEEKTFYYPSFELDSIAIESSLNMINNPVITITYKQPILPASIILTVSIDGSDREWFLMQPSSDHTSWSYEINLPQGSYCLHFAFAPTDLNDNTIRMWYPSWSMRGYSDRPLPTPSARIALANTIPEQLSIAPPVWCGTNLWVLPITNTATELQDLSLCSFSLGEPAGYVFFAESILIEPSETFYLSNYSENAQILYPNSNIYGDAGTTFPGETNLFLYDPSWNTIYNWELALGDPSPNVTNKFIPSEINSGGNGDWVEIFNYSNSLIDIGKYYLIDIDKNISLMPENCLIPPHSLFVVAKYPENFSNLSCQVIPLELGFDTASDSLSFYSLNNDLIFTLGWNSLWPINPGGLMFLKNPDMPFSSISNWEQASPPGTPGRINPGWNFINGFNEIHLVSQNPNNGQFSFYYITSSSNAEVLLFDISGRLISQLDLPSMYENEIYADFSNQLSNGVYFLYLRTSSGTASTRFTVLH